MRSSSKVKPTDVTSTFSAGLTKLELITKLTELGTKSTEEEQRTAISKYITTRPIEISQDNLTRVPDYALQTLGNICILLNKHTNISSCYSLNDIDNKLIAIVNKFKPKDKPVVKVVQKTNKELVYQDVYTWLDQIDKEIDTLCNNKNYKIIVPKIPETIDKVKLAFIKKTELPLWKQELSRLDDEETAEGYSNLTTRQLIQFKNFYTSLINLLSISKPSVPRIKKKKQSKNSQLEKQTKFLAYNEEKSSVNKTDILSSTELWGFNEKYRIVIHWVALPGTTFGLNRTALTSVDEAQSTFKRIRPNQVDHVLAELRKGNKNRCKAVYASIKSTEGTPSLRLSRTIILLNNHT